MKMKMSSRNVLVKNAAAASVLLLLAACAAETPRDPGVDRVRADYSALQSNPNLASRAPVAMQEADSAVRTAEATAPEDSILATHRIYIADRKVQTAKSLAQAEYAVDQRKALSDEGARIQLEARTREADAAKTENDRLLDRLADLRAKQTERGVEVTLGDVLFSTGRSEVKAGARGTLDKLVVALGQVTERQVLIEGFTDDRGADDANLALSQNRADSVSAYLTTHGVSGQRITSTGKGAAYPVADNGTASGRQLNRRVEITIQNPPQVSSNLPVAR